MVALLYVAHALPLYFFNVALPAILRHQGVDIRVIGMLSLLYLPWAFKFLWASYVDNYYCAKIGKRKTWLFFTQIIVVVGLFGLGFLQFSEIVLFLSISFWYLWQVPPKISLLMAIQWNNLISHPLGWQVPCKVLEWRLVVW